MILYTALVGSQNDQGKELHDSVDVPCSRLRYNSWYGNTIGLSLIPLWTSACTYTQHKETVDELAI